MTFADRGDLSIPSVRPSARCSLYRFVVRAVHTASMMQTAARAQCFLRLQPHIRCDTAQYWGVFALSIATIVALTVAFPVACTWALSRGVKQPYVEFLQAPLRDNWSLRSLWAGPIGFCRKLLIVVVVSAARGEDYLQTLPMLIAATLLLFLLMQVSAGARARARRVNVFPAWILALSLCGVCVDAPLLQVFFVAECRRCGLLIRRAFAARRPSRAPTVARATIGSSPCACCCCCSPTSALWLSGCATPARSPC
jgi:hypothetical protein